MDSRERYTAQPAPPDESMRNGMRYHASRVPCASVRQSCGRVRASHGATAGGGTIASEAKKSARASISASPVRASVWRTERALHTATGQSSTATDLAMRLARPMRLDKLIVGPGIFLPAVHPPAKGFEHNLPPHRLRTCPFDSDMLGAVSRPRFQPPRVRWWRARPHRNKKPKLENRQSLLAEVAPVLVRLTCAGHGYYRAGQL